MFRLSKQSCHEQGWLFSLISRICRSSHRRYSVKKGVLKDFANFTGKHLCRSLFLIKLQAFRPANLLKRYFNTGNFLWNLRNFYEHLFWRTSTLAASRYFSFYSSLRKILWSWCVILNREIGAEEDMLEVN